jgi:hypothetical protein
MAESLPNIDGLSPELKSFVVQVLEENARLKAECIALREENARLKGLKGRPKLKPSGMEKSTEAQAKGKRKPGRRGPKRSKLTINESKIIKAANIPAGCGLITLWGLSVDKPCYQQNYRFHYPTSPSIFMTRDLALRRLGSLTRRNLPAPLRRSGRAHHFPRINHKSQQRSNTTRLVVHTLVRDL